jgi:pyridoxal 5'-phosphate synthase pdxT subunit
MNGSIKVGFGISNPNSELRTPNREGVAGVKTVGVLALQGDYERHLQKLAACGVKGVEVRTLETLSRTDALIIPGGESTTLIRFFDIEGWWEPLRAWAASHPVMGTCAGAILMADKVTGPVQPSLGLLPIAVERNAYGRQVDSFTTTLGDHALGGGPLPAFFIRAPRILDIGEGVEVLARLNGGPVMVRKGNFLALTFHPELTPDTRVHEYFLMLY